MTDGLFLREKDRLEILRLLARHLPSAAAWAYGSRVNGGAHEGSDLDIVLRLPDLSPIPLEELRAFTQALRDSNIPILVEARDWARLPESFQQEIMKKYVVLRENLSEWMGCTLGNAPFEIIDGDRGKNYPSQNEFFADGYCVFLNTKNVTSSGFSFFEVNFITKEKDTSLRKGKLKRGDLVLTTRGTVGNVAYYNDSVVYDHIRINSGMVIIRPEGIDQRFNHQLFKYLKDQFDVFASGSAQPQLPIKDMKQIEVNLPPLPEQKAIASVLSSLDDKIDLLHRQNKTLEAMAEALFRQWFVEEAGEDWEERPLSDFGKIVCGKTPAKNNADFYGGDIQFVKIPDMHGKIYVFETTDKLSKAGKLSQQNKTIPKNSICVSCIATVGLVVLTSQECQTNQQINSIIPNKSIYIFYLYFIMKLSYDLLHAMASGGTATLNLNTGNFKEILVPYPHEDLLESFYKIASSYFEKIFKNEEQIRTLEKLRDTLLPKLMSGEVRVAC